MTYDLSGFQNSSNLLDMYGSINVASGGLLSILTLASIFLIIFLTAIKDNPVPESMVAASIPSGLVALLFLYAGVASAAWVVLFSVTLAGGLIALYKSNSI